MCPATLVRRSPLSPRLFTDSSSYSRPPAATSSCMTSSHIGPTAAQERQRLQQSCLWPSIPAPELQASWPIPKNQITLRPNIHLIPLFTFKLLVNRLEICTYKELLEDDHKLNQRCVLGLGSARKHHQADRLRRSLPRSFARRNQLHEL